MKHNRFTFFDKFYNTIIQEELFSIMDVDLEISGLTIVNLINNEKLESKYTPIFLETIYDKEIFHKEGIFKHSSGFYIYLSRNQKETTFKIRIIYKVEQYEQIKIYINGLKKIK